MIFGTIIPSSNVANVLKEEQYWKEKYDALNLASQNVQSQLNRSVNLAGFDFSKSNALMQRALSQNLLDTYSEGFDQKSSVMSSNLGQGYKEDIIKDLDSALDRAYESYILNYQQDKIANERNLEDTIAAYEQNALNAQNSIDAARSELDKAILEESEYASEFYSSIPEYLDWLYSEENDAELGAFNAFDVGNWSKYFTDENGYLGSKIIASNMYDEEGNLNEYGLDVFNMLLSNPLALQGHYGYSYEEYLEKAGRTDLAKWLSSTSNYSTEDNIFDNYHYLLKAQGIDPSTYAYIEEFKDAESDDEIVNVYNDKELGGSKIETVSDKTEAGYGLVNKYRGSNFGDITVYAPEKGMSQVISFDEFKLAGADKTINDRNGESFKVQYVDDSGNKHTYKLEVSNAKDNPVLTSDSDVYTYIQHKVGDIKANQIYAYGNVLYAAISDKLGNIVLRQLQNNSALNDDYNKIVNLISDKANWGNQYNTQIIKQGTKMTDGSIESSLVDKREREERLKRIQEYNKDPKGNTKPGYTFDFTTGKYKKINDWRKRN